MRIIINDFIQNSDAPDELKSPALADYYDTTSFTITLDSSQTFDSIGIGYTDATEITVNGDVISLSSTEKNGLYLLSSSQTTDTLVISHDGTYLGRFGCGLSRSIGAAKQREPGFYTTKNPRITASGQVVKGAGGYSGKRIGIDFRYKFTEAMLQDFEDAYDSQISEGYPFFLYFDKETGRMPYERLYARTDNEILFQSAIRSFLYSRRFDFLEAF